VVFKIYLCDCGGFGISRKCRLFSKLAPVQNYSSLKCQAVCRRPETAGAQGYWQKRLEFSRQEYDEGYGTIFWIAACHARLGERERAFEQLEKSLAAHESDLIWIKTEPAFDVLRDDPRFSGYVAAHRAAAVKKELCFTQKFSPDGRAEHYFYPFKVYNFKSFLSSFGLPGLAKIESGTGLLNSTVS
jgi:hypothetical protein